MQTEGLSVTAVEKALRRKGAAARGREQKVEEPLQRAEEWKDMDMDMDMVDIFGNIMLRCYLITFSLCGNLFLTRVSRFFCL